MTWYDLAANIYLRGWLFYQACSHINALTLVSSSMFGSAVMRAFYQHDGFEKMLMASWPTVSALSLKDVVHNRREWYNLWMSFTSHWSLWWQSPWLHTRLGRKPITLKSNLPLLPAKLMASGFECRLAAWSRFSISNSRYRDASGKTWRWYVITMLRTAERGRHSKYGWWPKPMMSSYYLDLNQLGESPTAPGTAWIRGGADSSFVSNTELSQ